MGKMWSDSTNHIFPIAFRGFYAFYVNNLPLVCTALAISFENDTNINFHKTCCLGLVNESLTLEMLVIILHYNIWQKDLNAKAANLTL